MKVAVIGGGASGLTTAYLLDGTHQVHLFERDQVLGGNIRTLNENAPAPGLPRDLHIENGVLGFHIESYPNFHKLMHHLGVDLHSQDCSAGLYKNNWHLPANSELARKRLSPLKRPLEVLRALGLQLDHTTFWRRLQRLEVSSLEDSNIQAHLPANKTLEEFIKGILMISYSTPYEHVEDLPAALTVPFLNALESSSGWSFVTGGVYTYVKRMMSKFSGEVSIGVNISEVKRNSVGASIKLDSGEVIKFDKVVFATTPGAVLNILGDPTESEIRLFGPWKDRVFQTIAHEDASIYDGYGQVYRTPMDVFLNADQRTIGYNTSMNEVYSIQGGRSYSFAYGLDEIVPADHVLHSHPHTVPAYTSDAYQTRHAISASNGQNHTYYAGAYLGNGLHEGAVSSALSVAALLDGLQL